MSELLLLAPGPTPVPERVRRRMSEPLQHHRQPAFKGLMKRIREGLQWLYQTDSDTLILSASGTGAMQAAITNFAARGERAIVVGGGKFGERWITICETFGLEVTALSPDWGQPVSLDDVDAALAAGPPALFIVTASETSTGTFHPVPEIARRVRDASDDTVLIVDAITALGVHDLPFDALGIDVMACGSQKAFGLPPGLSTLAVSPRAWRAAARCDQPRYYFDLQRERKSQAKNQTAFTSPISLVFGLCEVLDMMQEEGLPELIARHGRNANAVREAVTTGLGLELFSSSPSNALTAITMPESIDGQALVAYLRDELHVAIAGGQDHVKGRVVRIGHLGFVYDTEILVGLSRFQHALAHFGHQAEPGIAAAIAARSV